MPKISFIYALICLLLSCTSDNNNDPTKNIRQNLAEKGIKNYSLVLKDMGSDSNTDFWHEYEVIQYPDDKNGNVTTMDMRQTRVTAEYFEKNIDNLGMELGYSIDGNFKNEISDVGFNHLIGNPKYGKFMPAEEKTDNNWATDESLTNNSTQNLSQDSTTHRRRPRVGSNLLMWYFIGRYAGMNGFFRTRSNPISQNNFNQFQSYKSGATATPYRRFNAGTNPVSSGYGKTWNAFPDESKKQIKSRAKSSVKASRSAKSNSLRKRSGGFGK